MKQTAVEWLAEQMLHPQNHNPYINQAKQMEKKQIVDAICEGIQQFVVEFNEAKNTFTISYPDPNMIAEQYYNETYNSKQ